MGWWKINSPRRGQIDRSHDTGGRLLNAVPGRDTAENHYNGDGPADSMGEAADKVLGVVGIAVPKPGSGAKVEGISKRECLDLFLERTAPARFARQGDELLEVVSDVWEDIDEQYQEEWERPPYPEEREGICNFVLNPLFD